jgi:hypothetical protein
MAAAAHLVSSSAAMFTGMEHLVSASGTVAVASKLWGHCICIGICIQFICSGLENGLGCEKRGIFLVPSFSISLSLLSITMALSIMCWKST